MTRLFRLSATLLLLFSLCGFSGQDEGSGLVLNRDPDGLAGIPSFSIHPDGRTTYLWNSYQNGKESIWFDHYRDGRSVRSRSATAQHGWRLRTLRNTSWLPDFSFRNPEGMKCRIAPPPKR